MQIRMAMAQLREMVWSACQNEDHAVAALLDCVPEAMRPAAVQMKMTSDSPPHPSKNMSPTGHQRSTSLHSRIRSESCTKPPNYATPRVSPSLDGEHTPPFPRGDLVISPAPSYFKVGPGNLCEDLSKLHRSQCVHSPMGSTAERRQLRTNLLRLRSGRLMATWRGTRPLPVFARRT
jgi:hypothetical protein